MDLREANFTNEQLATSRHPWELARKRVVVDLLKSYLATKVTKTVLDVGCGDAWLVQQIRQSYPQHQYLGVDTALNPEQILHFQESAPSPVQLYPNLDQASASLGDQPVDLVLLLDVIEHIEDEVQFLRRLQIYTNISPQTVFLITVPAFQKLFCAHDKFLKHYRRYTQKSLAQALDRAGMQVKDQGYFFASLLIPRIGQVLGEKMQPTKVSPVGVGKWEGSSLITQALTQGLWNDYRLGKALRQIGLSLPGLSTYAMACPYE